MSEFANLESFLKPIDLQEWTGEIRGIGVVRMKQLSASRYSNEFQDWMNPGGKKNDERSKKGWSKLVTLCVVDENDKPVMSEEHVDVIEQMPPDVKAKLHRQALVVHGLIESDDVLGK